MIDQVEDELIYPSHIQPTTARYPEHVASLSKFAPQARNAGAEGMGGRRASQVEVFQRWGSM